MGMVNASIATATGNRIRVTHLTGPATDLAGNVVPGIARQRRGRRARASLGDASIREARDVRRRRSHRREARRIAPVRRIRAGRFDLVLALGFTCAPAGASPRTLDDAPGADDPASTTPDREPTRVERRPSPDDADDEHDGLG
jgi:hypothetical protein